MLKLEKINYTIEKKTILKDFSLQINDGEVHAIMGPNGTGKSSLSKMIMGHDQYRPESGKIIYDGNDISKMTTDEISRKGIFLAMQHPISIEGVSNSEFLRTALNSRQEAPIALFEFIKNIEQSAKELEIKNDILHRYINDGASGGERKKNEVLQIKLLKPKLIILDEIDSGLDVDSLRIVCENIKQYKEENPKTALLIITHYPRIFDYIKPDFVHILDKGKIVKTGAYDLAQKVEAEGYSHLGENNG